MNDKWILEVSMNDYQITIYATYIIKHLWLYNVEVWEVEYAPVPLS